MTDDPLPPAEMREIPLDEAMAMAILFQRNGQLEDAEKIYRRVLALVPDHVDALHFAGVLAHQQGRSAEGVALIERSLALVPDQADGHSNLGIIFRALGRLDDAVDAYRRAIAVNPEHANAYNNLGVLLKAQGKLHDAEQAYRDAIRINPEHTDAYTNLGNLLASTKRTPEAVLCYCKVTVLSPRHPEARRLLALAHCALGEPKKAVEIFEKWLEEEPGHVIARHMLAACSGRDVPNRAADAYVEKVFDDFAASFDTKLGHLSYRAPNLVAAMLADAGVAPARALDILDAGCGTGLCGPLVAPYARSLTGVDLSAGMLAQAEAKHVYDRLVKEELTAFLQRDHDAYDVIVSADTLVYFGALEEVLLAAAATLRPGGHVVFTLESSTDDSGGGVHINDHGRYSHSRAYVERVLAGAALDAEIIEAELRMEAGAPVAGFAIRATRSAGASPTPRAAHSDDAAMPEGVVRG